MLKLHPTLSCRLLISAVVLSSALVCASNASALEQKVVISQKLQHKVSTKYDVAPATIGGTPRPVPLPDPPGGGWVPAEQLIKNGVAPATIGGTPRPVPLPDPPGGGWVPPAESIQDLQQPSSLSQGF